jgi:biopolymer transport protein ExbB
MILSDAFDAVAELLEIGGPVLLLLFGLALALWFLLIERFWFLARIFPQRLILCVEEWQARLDCQSWHARQLREAKLSREAMELRRYLPQIKSLVALCPLLGLLGTVVGMIHVFDTLAVTGTGNARAMASGVSKATLPTMAGMVIAISGLYFSSRLEHRVQDRLDKLRDELVISSNASWTQIEPVSTNPMDSKRRQ